MRKYRTELIMQCDCCGKSKTYIDDDSEMKDYSQDDRYMWTNIRIDARPNKDLYLDNLITVCPDCCNSVLEVIKKKCNYLNNWPEPYNVEQIAVGNDEVKYI